MHARINAIPFARLIKMDAASNQKTRILAPDDAGVAEAAQLLAAGDRPQDEARGDHVDLRFPLRLVNVALGIAAKRGTMTVDGTPVDVDEIRRLVADPSFAGELMNVRADDGTTVVLSIE